MSHAFFSRRKLILVAAGSCASFCGGLAGARAQTDSVKAERLRQQGLPHATDPFWPKLKACKVVLDASSNTYKLTPTPEIRALEGQTVVIQGFTLPLDGSDHTQHFLLGVNTPVCYYHPPGEPNEVIEVFSLKPITWKDSALFVQGRFTAIDEPQMGVFFRLEDAKPVDPPSFMTHFPGMSGPGAQ